MGYEDFTTFTEVDVGADRIQKTEHHIDHYAICNETTYMYRDYGAAHFDDFTHKIKIKAVSADANGAGFVYVLANDLDNCKALRTGNKTYIGIYVDKDGTSLRIIMNEAHNGSGYWDWNTGGFSFGDWVYIKLVKSGTSFTAYLYSDSDYSTLVDTISLTLQGDHNFRYLYGCNTWNDSNSYEYVTDIENFDIGEFIPYPLHSGKYGGIGEHLQGGIGK